MTKRSIVNVRTAPVQGVAGATGSLVIHADTVTVQTVQRIELHDLTEQLGNLVRQSGVREGVVSVWSMHTTCSLFINEAQMALHVDITRFLESVVARDADYLHNDPDHSDCDRFNADSHLRAMLLGHSLALQISGGEMVLGQWQRILMAELDGPRARSLRVQVMGV